MMSVRFGLVSGLAIVVLAMVGVAIINLPKAEGAEPQGLRMDEACPTVQVAQDQGYGMSKVVTQHLCGGAVAH